MEDFQVLFNKAVQIKNADMQQKRVQFEQKPLFVKAGLYYWPKFEGVRNQHFLQRFFAAELLKSQGNAFFKKAQYSDAVKEYEQALSIFRFIRNKNKNWRKEGIYDSDLVYFDEEGQNHQEKSQIDQLKLAIYHNLATGYLQLKKYQAAQQACDESLKIDEKSHKALFRRAKSIYLDQNSNTEEYDKALKDLKLALEISPKDQQIQDLYLRISSDLQNIKKNESSTYKNMFGNSKSKVDLNQSQETRNELNEILKAAQQKLLEKQAQQEQQEKQNQISKNKNDDEQIRTYKRTGLKKSLKRGLVQSEQESQTENEISNTSIIKNNNSNQKFINTSKMSNTKNETTNLQNYWKMFKLESEITNDPTFTIENCYEIDMETQIPIELEKFGKILNLHGQKFIRMLKEAGKYEEARDVQIQINLQKEDKNKLEKLISLNLSRPTQKLQQAAQKYGVDLKDKEIYRDLEQMKKQYLKSIKKFIKKNNFESQVMQKSGNKQQKIEEKDSEQDSSDESVKKQKKQKKQDKKQKSKRKQKKSKQHSDSDESSSYSSSDSDSDIEIEKSSKKNIKKQRTSSKSRKRGSSTSRSLKKNSKHKQKKYNTDFEDDNFKKSSKNKKRSKSARSSSSNSSGRSSSISSQVSSSSADSSDQDDKKSRKSKRSQKQKKQKQKKLHSSSQSCSDEEENIKQISKKKKKQFKPNNKYQSQTDNDNDYSLEGDQYQKKGGLKFKNRTYKKSKTDNEGEDSDQNYQKNNLNKYFTKDYKSNKRKQYNDNSGSDSSSDSDKSVASHHTSKYKKGRKKANQDGKKYHLTARSASSSSSNSDSSESENEDQKYKKRRRKKFNPKKSKDEEESEEEEIQYKKNSKKSGHLTDVNDIDESSKKNRRENALALPEEVEKKHKKSKKEKKQEKKLKKKEKKDPLAPTPYAPFGFSKDGRPLTSADDPEFNMSYYHPEMEVNYCNPSNDPTVQISSNNKHNNLVEDFTTRGSYYRLQYNSEEIKLQNKDQMLQTKDLVYQKNDQELYEVSEKEENYTTSLIIFVSIGFFLVTLIYYFFNQSTEISDEQTQENMIMGAQKLGLKYYDPDYND